MQLLMTLYFSPGRFLSKDPKEFGGGDANFYRYVFNSPTNATDPTGLDYNGMAGGAISGFGFGGVTGFVTGFLKGGLPRAHASPLLQNTVSPEDFFKKIGVQGRGEPLLGDAQLGRVRLQQR